MTADGFPHSEIPGSTVACTSPRLIAACHVLHRLLVPRHPPYALNNLTENPWFAADRFYSLPPDHFWLSNTRFYLQTVVKEQVIIFDGELSFVENTGFEPVTSALQGRRSPS